MQMPLSHRFLCLPLVLSLLACGTSPMARSAKERISIDLPVAGAADIATRQAAIRAEIARLGIEHPWAGVYRWQGRGELLDPEGTCMLEVAPESGFVRPGRLVIYSPGYRTEPQPKSLDQDDQWSFGSTRFSNGVLHLGFEVPNRIVDVPCAPEDYRVIRWGQRTYLVPVEQLSRFVNAVNGGLEPRAGPDGLFPLRIGDECRPAGGKPELPPEHAAHLLEKPIVAHIMGLDVLDLHSTGKWMHLHEPVHVDVGKADGAFVGMELIFVEPPDSGWLLVTKVGEHASEGEYGYYGDGQPLPRNGWTCSTRRP